MGASDTFETPKPSWKERKGLEAGFRHPKCR
jgi:hypothetical protein